MKIIIYGRIPSKKNSVGIMFRGGKIHKFPSSKYQAWHSDASKQIRVRYPGLQNSVPVERALINITIFAPDKRAADLTNKAESIMDLLVDNRVILDDNWFNIPSITITFRGVDREKARAEIEIITMF